MSSEENLRKVSQEELDALLKLQAAYVVDRQPKPPDLTKLLIADVVVPDNTDFSFNDLALTRFEVPLRKCTFRQTKTKDTNFTKPVEGCTFSFCEYMDRVHFREVSGTTFLRCNILGKWHESKFSGCTFSNVLFSKIELEHIQFAKCSFSECVFNKVRLYYVHFGHALLTRCELRDADMSLCFDFTLDATDIRNARLPVRSKDPWSQLVRSYTGVNMIINLLFLALFFVPMALKGVSLVAMSHIEARLSEKSASIAAG